MYNQSTYYTGTQAAKYLRKHLKTIQLWRKNGQLQPQIEAAGITLYSQEYLDQKKDEIDARGETRGRKKKVESKV